MRRRGGGLYQVLAVTALMLIIAVMVMKWQLQRHQVSAKAQRQSQLHMDTEGLRSSISTCLGSAGYPSGSCQPTPAQAHCVPAGVSVTFSGIPPNCGMQITATR